jgi:uncharacterized membrane protein (UPF0127 family)
MIAKIKFNGRTIEIPDVEKASGFKKFSGLMFKGKDTNALLFEMSNSSIHSFFCKNFLAIWLNNGKIVDYQIIDKSKASIKPEKEFTHLLEVPVNEKYAHIISIFS